MRSAGNILVVDDTLESASQHPALAGQLKREADRLAYSEILLALKHFNLETTNDRPAT